jgi:hypothetical protein
VGFFAIQRDITKEKGVEERVKKREKELEQMNALMIGRELKMIELKKEISKLEERLGGHEGK